MSAVEVSSSNIHEAPDRVHGPYLVGGWRTMGITAWVLVWLLSLVIFFLAISIWYRWDSTPIAESALIFPDVSAENQASMVEHQQAIREIGMTLPFYGGLFAVLRLISGIPFFILSVLIVLRRSDHLMAILFAIVLAVMGAAGRWIFPNWNPVPGMYPWTETPIQVMQFILDSSLILAYAFPDGRFVPRWTRWLALATLLFGVGRHFLNETPLNPDNLPWNVGDYQARIFFLIGLYALVYRYRRDANAVQKQQIKWILAGALLLGVFYFIHYFLFMTPLYERWAIHWTAREVLISAILLEPGWYVGQSLLAVAIGLALFRFRLWDIDLVINRALVYGSLTILTMMTYLAAVAAFGSLFRGVLDPVIFFLATGLVAILFEPLRRRLQRLVNRLMYGERDDPYAVLTRLLSTLEHSSTPSAMLPAVAATVGQALKIPFVSIQILQDDADQVVAVYGKPQSEIRSFPLTYQGEVIGSLQAGLRTRGEEFSTIDRRLIENIVLQAGAAAQAVRLNTALVRSRAEIVSAREEERRRLRRDLHDGLGPILASQTLKMAAVRQLVRQNPERAESVVDDVIQQNENTVLEVRRLVYGLRPPALDELGLIEAVRDLVRRGGQDDLGANGMEIRVAGAEQELPKLPAAVEVNAYRIAMEALTNAARHSQARQCTIRFDFRRENGDEQDSLVVEIVDDGVGMPEQYRAGVGIRSMRERAEELGGSLTITKVIPHGTQITALLPLLEWS